MKIGKLRTDEDCHWYLIPDDKVKRFDKIMHEMEQLDHLVGEEYSDWEDEFINRFERYRLPGGPFKLDVIMQP